MRPVVPLVSPAAGCAGTGRELARFGDLAHLETFVLGRVGASGSSWSPPRVTRSPGGLLHEQAPCLPVARVVGELLPWLQARGVRVTCALRAGTPGVFAEVAARLRRSLHFGCVEAVEIDLGTARDSARPAIGGIPQDEPWTPHSADPQSCLRVLSRVREQVPRDLLLVARLGMECPDPVAAARAAVGGGASALLLSGSVPAQHPGQWLSGPAVAPVTLGLLGRMREAMATGRLPEVPLLATGGIRDAGTARAALHSGADGVRVGTALFTDPALLWTLGRELRRLPGRAPLPDPAGAPAPDRGAARG